MFFKRKPVYLGKLSSPKKPFRFPVNGKQLIEILENIDPTRIKRGIDCGPLNQNQLFETKEKCSPEDVKKYVLDYSREKNLSEKIKGEYVLYWDKKTREYTHQITLSGARSLDFYLEFGTNSSQKLLDKAFNS